MRILMIDDELYEDSSRVAMLKKDGYDVKVLNRARQLPQVLDSESGYDAVVVDIMMPPTDYAETEQTDGGRFTGVLVVRDIQRAWPGVPIVVVTAHRSDDVADKLPLGCVILEKPLSHRKLVGIIRAGTQLVKAERSGRAG